MWINENEETIRKVYEAISNPYFLGYGDPDSKILIIGKEKGFNYDANNFMQFFHERFNNQFYWKQIIEKTGKPELNPEQPYKDALTPFPYQHLFVQEVAKYHQIACYIA